ncbi:YceI family protein [Cyclobacterium marinum DSM 745]|uniref:YceI family protein n=2 Tax=Cyclobacteriaceae TaxID=563798 RepID=G0J1T1_CYCMS|nr:YceI family protein [Cyclobacterium marinum DSM 745]|tara:strand:- start:48845 stop:49441 length:597 start_codon:yes stop_codon:yes gene_type:complete
MHLKRRLKHKIQMKWTLLLAVFIVAGVETVAQNSFTLSTDQELKVEGTSTIHDWEMISDKAKGSAEIELKGNKITGINSMVINLPATSLKSGKGSMDNNAYEALNTKEFPEIQFSLVEVKALTDQSLQAMANLTIAGNTHLMSFKVDYEISGDTIQFIGSFPVNFTQFKMDPPKAMFGTIKTGDKLQISFETIFKLIK